MTRNHLVTGPPRSGKTTVLERVVDRLRERGLAVGGVVTPERRVDGERVGFACRALDTGETATVASVERERGPRVGKYRVDVAAVAAGDPLPERPGAVVHEVTPETRDALPARIAPGFHSCYSGRPVSVSLL